MSTVTFTFDGVTYQGDKGETLASALLRNGIVHVAGATYHRAKLKDGVVERMLPWR